jgi:hypothetical protein
MACTSTTETTATGTSIADVLSALGPIKVEGDQGAWTGRTVSDAIKAADWDRKNRAMTSKAGVASVLRTIGGHRLISHDGRAS